jgi:hypothetical protein
MLARVPGTGGGSGRRALGGTRTRRGRLGTPTRDLGELREDAGPGRGTRDPGMRRGGAARDG